MEDWKSKVVGGAIVLVLGGTGFAISQTDVVDNFASETGMSQEEAQKYVNETQENLDSFGNIGSSHAESGNELLAASAEIDCVNYEYTWESASLSCADGKNHLYAMAQEELRLGQCYEQLDRDLGPGARAQITQCMADIDAFNASLQQSATSQIFGSDFDTQDAINTNLYNKSVLKAALEAK